MIKRHVVRVLPMIWLCSALLSCGGSKSASNRASGTQNDSATQLTGAGSTFVYPFFSKAFYEYSKQHANVNVNYQSIGSGGGIQQFTQKTVDFGASDVPMNTEELKRAKDPVIQIPVALGGESIVYNLPGLRAPLRLDRQTLADIYLGKVPNWNSSQLSKLNPGVNLPNLPIAVVHRSDGSGTTYIFTDFLSGVSAEWLKTVGRGKSVSWRAATSVGKGNEGVAGQVRNTPGAVGYVELAYALANHMQAAVLENASHGYVGDTADSVRAAAATEPSVSASHYSIVNRPGPKSYPIAGYTWAMVYQHPKDAARARLVRDVLQWTVGPKGQAIAGTLQYVPLPSSVQSAAQSALKRMQF